jgi:hypothetical protein
VELVDPDNPNTQDIVEVLLDSLDFKEYQLGSGRPEFYYTRMNKEGEIKLFHNSKKHPPPSLIIATRGEGAFVVVRSLRSNIMYLYISEYRFNIFKPDEITRMEALIERFKDICKKIGAEADNKKVQPRKTFRGYRKF